MSMADSPENILLQLLYSTEKTFLIIDCLDEMEMPLETTDSLLRLCSRDVFLNIALITRDIWTIRKKLTDLPRIEVTPCDV